MGHLTRIANAVAQSLEKGPVQGHVSEAIRGEPTPPPGLQEPQSHQHLRQELLLLTLEPGSHVASLSGLPAASGPSRPEPEKTHSCLGAQGGWRVWVTRGDDEGGGIECREATVGSTLGASDEGWCCWGAARKEGAPVRDSRH